MSSCEHAFYIDTKKKTNSISVLKILLEMHTALKFNGFDMSILTVNIIDSQFVYDERFSEKM